MLGRECLGGESERWEGASAEEKKEEEEDEEEEKYPEKIIFTPLRRNVLLFSHYEHLCSSSNGLTDDKHAQ